MAVKVTLTDHTAAVKAQLDANVLNALTAMGVEAVALTVDKMQNGYGAPIRKTGNLQRDVQFALENSEPDTVDVGNTLEYGPFVHEGTYKMYGRPYLKDAITEGKARLQAVAEQELKKGFT